MVIQVSKYDQVTMLVEIIINEQITIIIMCTANVRIIPIAIYILKKVCRFNHRACYFNIFPGGHTLKPP